ncbi:MAG: AzlC family ABC transporter permease [Oscillospiraceae bacterium]|nr:AzlC family ABC transporter permease [Oscillospiraceae bacterium]MBR0452162.1 AzlC family ABC transporter permease [Oscillospiraceae bacterium]
MEKLTFKTGLKDGVPIALGYLFVSIGFGITAINSGLNPLMAIIISATNVTSAGQVAGVRVLSESVVFLSSALEMFLTQFVINLRYSLMGISLSQKTDSSFDTKNRMICAYSITDEIYAVASTRKSPINVSYFLGLSFLPVIGWTVGTAIGAFVGSSIDPQVSAIFGLAIYGMFLSIFIPPAKKSKGILVSVFLGAIISCLIYYIPSLSFISSGFSVIISSLVGASVAALLLPHKEDEE